MSNNLLTEEDCNQILQRRFANPNVKFVASTVKQLSDVKGFLGDYYRMEITYELNGEREVEYFFIKAKPVIKSELLQTLLNESNVFATETFLYGFLFREFDKRGLDTSFAPKCYYCVQDNVLVMEDLTRKGFRVSDPMEFFDLDQCKCGLKALAAFQAGGLLFEQMKTKELGRTFCIKEEYPEIFDEKFFTHFNEKKNVAAEEWFNDSVDLCLYFIDLLPETEEYKEDFKACLRNQPLGKIFAEETKITKFLGHSDLWATNMLMKFENGVAKQCCLVDYQLARYFYAAYDVLLFLLSNTDTKFYKKYQEELLSFYYKSLSDALAKHNYSVNEFYSMEDFRRSLEIVEFEAKLQSFAVHSFVVIPETLLTEYKKNMKDVDFVEYRFKNRIPIIKDIFQKDEKYRNMLITDLYELRVSLRKS